MKTTQRGSFLSIWFVGVYFISAISGLWVHLLNPNAAFDQTIEASIIRVSAAFTLMPLITSLFICLPRSGKNLDTIIQNLPWVTCIPIIAIVTIIIGLLNGNGLGFVIGDAYRLLTLPVGILIGMNLPLRVFMKCFVIMSITYISLFLLSALPARLSGDLNIVGIGTFHLLAALCIFPLLKEGSRSSRIGLIALSLIVIAVGMKRSTMGIFMILVLTLSFTEKMMRQALVLIILAGTLFFSIYSEEIALITELSDRINQTYDAGELDPSSGSRIQEVKSSWDHMWNKSSLGPLQVAFFGLGSGATYLNDHDDLRLSTIAPDSDEIHNIHFSPMTLAFRHGIIPALIIIYAYVSCLVYCLQVRRRSKDKEIRKIALSIFLFGGVLMLYSLSGFTIVGDLLFPVAMGSLLYHTYIPRKTKHLNEFQGNDIPELTKA